jgi:DedD protein
MMDRSLKERIIGAAVLVAFVVLVVPVFLDGSPQSGEVISKRVPLPGQADEQKTQTIILQRDRNEPVPLAASNEPVEQHAARGKPTAASTEHAAITEKAAASAAPPDPRPKTPPPTVVDATSSSTGMWAVQLGSFSNPQNAEKLAAELRKQGFAAFLSQLTIESGPLHRVRIGPQKDRDSAEAMAARLKRAGHTGQVVPHP